MEQFFFNPVCLQAWVQHWKPSCEHMGEIKGGRQLTYCKQICSREIRFIDVLPHLPNPYVNVGRQEWVDLLQMLPLINNRVVEGERV